MLLHSCISRLILYISVLHNKNLKVWHLKCVFLSNFVLPLSYAYQRLHPTKMNELLRMQQQFSKKITTSSIQEQSSSSSSRPIQYFMREVAPVSQEKFNKLVLNFVIQGLHPLSIVERAELKELFKQILPSRHVMSRKTLVRMLEDQYISMKADMCKVLSEQEFVATTTDAWSTNHKSYLGVTVH